MAQRDPGARSARLDPGTGCIAPFPCIAAFNRAICGRHKQNGNLRDFSLAQLYRIVIRAGVTTAVIMFVISASSVLGWQVPAPSSGSARS